jgi:hypothetical protein
MIVTTVVINKLNYAKKLPGCNHPSTVVIVINAQQEADNTHHTIQIANIRLKKYSWVSNPKRQKNLTGLDLLSKLKKYFEDFLLFDIANNNNNE